MSVQPDMIGIVVRDMAVALGFYRLLGLAIPEGQDGDDHVEVTTPNGYRIAWDTEELVKSLDSQWVEPVGQRTTIAFKCASPSEVDEVHSRLVDAGHHSHKPPWDAFWGQRYAIVSDPDGNHLDLFAPL